MSFSFARRRSGGSKDIYSVTVVIPTVVFFLLLAGMVLLKCIGRVLDLLA